MHVNAVFFLCIGDICLGVFAEERACVADFTAAFSVENGAVCNDYRLARGDIGALVRFAINEREHFCLRFELVVADERCLCDIGKRIGCLAIPASDIAARLSCATLLLGEIISVALFVNGDAALRGNLTREVYREAVGIGKLESIGARDGFCSVFLGGAHQIFEQVHAGFDRS